MLQTTANLKETLSSDIKKAVKMVVDVDLQMQMNYINRDDFQEKMQEVDDKLVNKMGIPEFNEALQQFDEDLKEENKETYEYIQSVKKHFAVVTKEIEKIREDFRAYDERLIGKTSVEETQQIWDNFNKFAFYDDLKDLYNRTLPELSRFEERLIKQNATLEKNDIILRRYDEVLTEKASKIDVKDLEKLMRTGFTPIQDFKDMFEKLNDRITHSTDKNRETERSIDMMGKNISKDIYSAVKRATANISKGPGDPGNISEFGALGSIGGGEDFRSLIISKADKFELENMQIMKANKCDTDLCFKWLDVLQK